MNLYKFLFYILLIINNIIALFFISICFLSGPPSMESPNAISEVQLILRLTIYAIIVSLLFSLFAIVIVYIFRRCIILPQRITISKIFGIEFIMLMFIFLVIYAVMYL